MLLLLHRLTLIISPLPKNGKNCPLVLLKTFVKSALNRSLSCEYCPENFREIGFFLTIVFQWNLTRIFLWNSPQIGRFFRQFVSENPTKFDFFSATYQRPCVMNGLRNKSSWSRRLFFSLPLLFSLHERQRCLTFTNRILKKVKVWITLEA